MVIKKRGGLIVFVPTYMCYLIFNARENRKDKTLSSRSFSCPAYLSLEPTSGTKIVFVWLSESLTLKLILMTSLCLHIKFTSKGISQTNQVHIVMTEL